MRLTHFVAVILAFSLCATTSRSHDVSDKFKILAKNKEQNPPEGRIRDGKCGKSLTWMLEGGILSINGNGDMNNYSNSEAPWYNYRLSITKVVLGQEVTSIGNHAFYQCEKMTSVSFPEGLTFIGKYSFYGCDSLSKVSIPASVSLIGAYAFSWCHGLQTIEINSSNSNYKSIDGVLFDHDASTIIQYPLAKKTIAYSIPSGVKSIGNDTFAGNSLLESVIIPDSVQSIGSFAFIECKNLVNVDIPTSVKLIGEKAFYSCDSLKSLFIPASVSSISSHAFSWCRNLSSLTVDKGNKKYKSIDGVLFNRDGTTLIQYPIGNTNSSYTIPESVTTIGIDSFAGNTHLEDIRIPAGVSLVEDYALKDCNISIITVPESVVSIGRYALSSKQLKTLFYQGSQTISGLVFGKVSPSTVCVSPNYHSSRFGDANVTSEASICQDFQNLFNHCFKSTYSNEGFVQEMMINATQWVNKKEGCMEHFCLNESGPVRWSGCNSSAKRSLLCVENQCIEREDYVKDKIVVELVLTPGIPAGPVNLSEILLNISSECGIRPEDLKLGCEVDEKGDLLKIVVIVPSKDEMILIEKTLDSIDKGDKCKIGILCNISGVIFDETSLSGVRGTHNHDVSVISVLFLLMLILALII